MYGSIGRILRINLTEGSLKDEELKEEVVKANRLYRHGPLTGFQNQHSIDHTEGIAVGQRVLHISHPPFRIHHISNTPFVIPRVREMPSKDPISWRTVPFTLSLPRR